MMTVRAKSAVTLDGKYRSRLAATPTQMLHTDEVCLHTSLLRMRAGAERISVNVITVVFPSWCDLAPASAVQSVVPHPGAMRLAAHRSTSTSNVCSQARQSQSSRRCARDA